MKNIFKISCLLLISSSLFIGCKKQHEEFIKGTWELLSKPNEEVEYLWTFTDSKVYVMATDAHENDAQTGELDTCSYGAYVLKNNVLTIALDVAPCRSSTYAGDWDIQGLDNDFMTLRLETSNGTIWYEFEKK